MPIIRRVEYVIACDGPDCYNSEAHNCETRDEAIAAALRYGWIRCTRGRWLCPTCADKARARFEKPPADEALRPLALKALTT